MRVSQFEIYRLVQRALEGAGAPYGVDRDGAQAVAWLEARGLPGLRLLRADLPGLDGKIRGLALRREEIDAGGLSAIACGSAVVDIARGRPSLGLRRCRSPLFLLPAAIASGLTLCWRQAAGEVRCCASGLHGSAPALLDPTPADVEIRSGDDAPPARPAFLDAAELARRYGQALEQGVEVDEELWREVDVVAARVQVPASPESRLKGAGGGDANL